MAVPLTDVTLSMPMVFVHVAVAHQVRPKYYGFTNSRIKSIALMVSASDQTQTVFCGYWNLYQRWRDGQIEKEEIAAQEKLSC